MKKQPTQNHINPNETAKSMQKSEPCNSEEDRRHQLHEPALDAPKANKIWDFRKSRKESWLKNPQDPRLACPHADRAEILLRRADKLAPNDTCIPANLGRALAKQGKPGSGLALLRAIERAQPGNSCRQIAEHCPALDATATHRLSEIPG
jgi:hypothetical protein